MHLQSRNKISNTFYTGGVAAWMERHHRALLLMLIIVGAALRFFIAWREPFLHDWDERFHALVARNMMDHPFAPMLRAHPVISYDPNEWCCNHIWLHKQPLFLWQMALSMKMFGVNLIALRLPSILMGSTMILLIFRIADVVAGNKAIAVFAAALISFSHYHLILISGIKGMDHNDVALGFYVLCSIWCLVEYFRNPTWFWAAGVGIFSGGAVLNKWLIGLFPFLVWGLYLILQWKLPSRKQFLLFTLSLFACLVVFVPWQIYILNRWPAEAHFAYQHNSRHIFEVIEGHEGSFLFYAGKISNYLSYAWPLFFIGLIVTLKKGWRNETLLLSLAGALAFVFLFFSLVVRTKIESFFFFVVPVCLIFMAIGMHALMLERKVMNIFLIACLCWLSLDPLLFRKYTWHNAERLARNNNNEIYRNLRSLLPEKYKVVMNVNEYEDVELMFYQNDISAYSWWFSEADLEKLKTEKVPIAVFRNHGNYNMPNYVFNYPYLFVIDKELR